MMAQQNQPYNYGYVQQNSDVNTKLPKEVEMAEKESEKKSQKVSTEHDQKTSLAQKPTDESNVQLDSKFMPMYYAPMASPYMNQFVQMP